MQHWELRLPMLLDHAAREHGPRPIVSADAQGCITRTDWAGIRCEALKLVQALRRSGVAPGDRVATLAMNHAAHLVAWYGAVGAGAVLHTINPRLFDDQLEFIANHAEDRILLYDAAFAPIVERMKPRWRTIERYICFDTDFAAWLALEDGDAAWTPGGERDPSMLCYTSGTTGHPKGVLFEHRSTVLHSWATIAADAFAIRHKSVVLPVTPMFHANNWGLPWACAMVGAKMVYSAANASERLCELIESEAVTHVSGVPTVWLAMLEHLERSGKPLPSIEVAISGGSSMPRSVVDRLTRGGVRLVQAWGMTETSPVATIAYDAADWRDLDHDAQVSVRATQGRALFGCAVRVVSLDDPAVELPRDGRSAGALQVRGPWVVRRYFRAEADASDAEGWFDTGDVAAIAPDGTVRLTDRTKDLIKSGGEWISSVDLENAAVAHPGVAEAAAIGVPHPKWAERPLLVIVRKPESTVCAAELRAFLAERVAKWWLPDAVEFVDEIPHTGSGKISKKDLRERFRDFRLEG
jgi:fatty-acyl-CoA synthase